MKTINERAPPSPESSTGLFWASYNIGIIPQNIATIAKIIPLLERSDNHIAKADNEIIEMPSSHETISPDHRIQGPKPIKARTRGVKVATDQPNVVCPFRRPRYQTCPIIRSKHATNWT